MDILSESSNGTLYVECHALPVKGDTCWWITLSKFQEDFFKFIGIFFFSNRLMHHFH